MGGVGRVRTLNSRVATRRCSPPAVRAETVMAVFVLLPLDVQSSCSPPAAQASVGHCSAYILRCDSRNGDIYLVADTCVQNVHHCRGNGGGRFDHSVTSRKIAANNVTVATGYLQVSFHWKGAGVVCRDGNKSFICIIQQLAVHKNARMPGRIFSGKDDSGVVALPRITMPDSGIIYAFSRFTPISPTSTLLRMLVRASPSDERMSFSIFVNMVIAAVRGGICSKREASQLLFPVLYCVLRFF